MRGGLERWKRGVSSRGVRQAIAYALEGTCDAHRPSTAGVDALEKYAEASDATVSRFVVDRGVITSDELTAGGLRVWITEHDPITGEERGRSAEPRRGLLLDGTINHPKTYSVAALLHPELAAEFEALQDRLRDRILLTWHSELNARRGRNGVIREDITRIEVVELRHRRSRALDPHIHRHLWLNIKVLGVDGRWTNLDSRVAMKLHTVINAGGELAARTGPGWVAALARHVVDLDDRIARLDAFEGWGTPTRVDFESLIGADLWEERWRNHRDLLARMRVAETIAEQIRQRLAATHAPIEPPAPHSATDVGDERALAVAVDRVGNSVLPMEEFTTGSHSGRP